MEYKYRPNNVCSQELIFNIDEKEDIINDLKVIGGCNGNLKGISSLVKGMKVDEVISKLSEIKCNNKQTSCPDQIAKSLMKYKNRDK